MRDGDGHAGGHVGEIEALEAEGRVDGPRDARRRGNGHRHGTIFSIGRTRMPDAPEALSLGRRPHTSSAPTTEWIAIIPSCASGMTVGDSRAGSSASRSGRQAAGAFIIRYLRPRAAMTALIIVSMASRSAAALAIGGRIGDEDRLRLEDVADLAQAVHHERGAGRDEIDDGLGKAEAGRDLDGARDRDDVDRDALGLEEATGRVGVGGGDAQAAQVFDGPVRRVVGNGGGQAAAPVPELADPWQLGAGLREEVDAGDAEVRHAVADELDDVVRADEQDVEVVVLDAGHEAAVVLVEHESGIVKEPKGGFDHPPLVRDGEPEALPHRSAAVG